MLVCSVLAIILFFKVWGMTNNVRALKEYFVDGIAPANSKGGAARVDVPGAPKGKVAIGYQVRLNDSGKVGVLSSTYDGTGIVKFEDGKTEFTSLVNLSAVRDEDAK